MVTKIPAPQYPDNPEEVVATAKQREYALKAADALADGFNWEHSVEGWNFWDGVYARLKAISRGEPLK